MPSRPKISCPHCDSANLRSVKPKNLNEFIGELLGTYSFRCARCGNQFQHSVFGLSTIFNAKCPRCFRMDLTTWSESHYRPTSLMRLQMLFGARRVRCEACRCNFVSFRKRSATYVRPNGGGSSDDSASERAMAASPV